MNIHILISLLFIIINLTVHVTAAKKCNLPVTPEFLKASQECLGELGEHTSSSCAQVCVLKKFKIIENGEVQNQNWQNWISKSYPTDLVIKIVDALKKCSKLYEPTKENVMCDENDDFYHCIEDTIDKICDQ